MVGKSGLVRRISLPLVQTLGAPVLVRVAGTVLVVSIATSGVVGKSGLVGRLSFPLVQTLGAPVLIRVAGTVLVVSIATSGVVGKSGLVRRLSLPLVIAVAADGEAIAVVLRSVAVAITMITLAAQGTGREAEDNQRFCCHDFLCKSSSAELQCASESH